MTDQNIKDIIKLKEDAKMEGRYEGAAITLIGGIFYLIIVAAVMRAFGL